jgi:hypothetical protein
MAIVYRDGNTRHLSLSGQTLTIPATIQQNDVAFLEICIFDGTSDTTTLSTPSGWTRIGALQQDTVTTAGYYYRVLVTADAGATVAATYSSTAGVTKGSMTLTAYSGGDITGPVADSAFFQDTATGTAHTFPTIVTTDANEMVIGLYAERVAAAATSFSASAGTTIRQADLGSTGATVDTCGVDGTAPVTSAGTTTGGTTVTSTGTSSGHVFMMTIGIKPAVTSVTDLPASDITTTSWNKVGGSGTFASLTSDTDDTTFAESAPAPVSQVIEEKLSTAAAPISSVTARMRAGGGAASSTAVVALVQNTTIIASATFTPLTSSFADYSFNLNSTQQSNQTDLTNLRIRVTVTAS